MAKSHSGCYIELSRAYSPSRTCECSQEAGKRGGFNGDIGTIYQCKNSRVPPRPIPEENEKEDDDVIEHFIEGQSQSTAVQRHSYCDEAKAEIEELKKALEKAHSDVKTLTKSIKKLTESFSGVVEMLE